MYSPPARFPRGAACGAKAALSRRFGALPSWRVRSRTHPARLVGRSFLGRTRVLRESVGRSPYPRALTPILPIPGRWYVQRDDDAGCSAACSTPQKLLPSASQVHEPAKSGTSVAQGCRTEPPGGHRGDAVSLYGSLRLGGAPPPPRWPRVSWSVPLYPPPCVAVICLFLTSGLRWSRRSSPASSLSFYCLLF